VAGAFYGVQGIPATWLEKLHRRMEILGMAEALYGAALGSHTKQNPKAQPD